VLFMARLAALRRRSNDGLGEADGDTRFAAEVKRIARARGFTLRKLAERLAKHHSVVLRQLRESKSSQDKTADAYADAIGVPHTYLRLVARQRFADEAEGAECVAEFRLLFASALPWMQQGRREALWSAVVASLRSDAERGERVLIEAYLVAKRRRIDEELGLGARTDPVADLREALVQLGLKPGDFFKRVDDGVLAELYLHLSVTVGDDDAVQLIDHYREIIRTRDDYTPQMDDHLAAIRRDPTYVRTLVSKKEKA